MTIRGQTSEVYGQQDLPLPPSYLPNFPVKITLDQKTALHKMARVMLARECAKVGDVLGWGQALLPEKFKLPFCDMHEYIAEHRHDEFFCLEAPRGHAKTTCSCMLVPLYQALNEPDSFYHYLQIQATDDKALSVNGSIKIELEQNEFIRLCYGNQVGTDRWTNGQFVLKNGVCFTAVGAGQSIRGINYRNRRPDYLMIDDIYNEEDIYNVVSTEKKNAWFWGTAYPARAKGKKACVRVTGTPVNNEDLLEKIRGKTAWVHESFKAAKDPDVGPVLWPELNSLEQLQRDRKNMPEVIFLRELMCERRDDSTSIVKELWLNNWEYDPIDLKFNENLGFQGCVIGIDPSVGKNEENDFTAYALVIKAQPNDGSSQPVYYIESLVNEHLTMQERLDQVKELTSNRNRETPVTLVRVEGISGFADFADKVASSATVACEVVTRVPNKLLNLEKHSVVFQNKRVMINKNISQDLKDMLRHQITQNYPKHDDLRDAVLLALGNDEIDMASWV